MIDPATTWVSRLGGRKFLACILVVGVTLGLLVSGKLDQDHFVNLLEWIVGVYIGGQAAVDAVGKLGASRAGTVVGAPVDEQG